MASPKSICLTVVWPVVAQTTGLLCCWISIIIKIKALIVVVIGVGIGIGVRPNSSIRMPLLKWTNTRQKSIVKIDAKAD